jgi:hypothetical protein
MMMMLLLDLIFKEEKNRYLHWHFLPVAVLQRMRQ